MILQAPPRGILRQPSLTFPVLPPTPPETSPRPRFAATDIRYREEETRPGKKVCWRGAPTSAIAVAAAMACSKSTLSCPGAASTCSRTRGAAQDSPPRFGTAASPARFRQEAKKLQEATSQDPGQAGGSNTR